MRLILGVLAAALAVAASGCGGGDSDGEATTTDSGAPATSAAVTATSAAVTEETATRPEAPADQSRWARQVDAACRPWQEKIDAVAPPADEADLERWLSEALPLIRKQVAAVDAVQLPAAETDADAASRLVTALNRVERNLTQYQAALLSGDAEAAQQALAQAGAAGAESRTEALALEITRCGGYSDG